MRRNAQRQVSKEFKTIQQRQRRAEREKTQNVLCRTCSSGASNARQTQCSPRGKRETVCGNVVRVQNVQAYDPQNATRRNECVSGVCPYPTRGNVNVQRGACRNVRNEKRTRVQSEKRYPNEVNCSSGSKRAQRAGVWHQSFREETVGVTTKM